MTEDLKLKEAFILTGAIIRKKREEQSISIQKLANELGMSIARLESIEDGAYLDITISELILISGKLNMSLNEIFIDFPQHKHY